MESAPELLHDRQRRPADADGRARPESGDAKPGTLDPSGLARMQRAAGNAAVRLMVQRSMAAAPPGRKPAPLPLGQLATEAARETVVEEPQRSLDRSKRWAAPPELPRNGLQRSPRRRASLPERVLVGAMTRIAAVGGARRGATRGAGLGAGALGSVGRMLGMGENALGGVGRQVGGIIGGAAGGAGAVLGGTLAATRERMRVGRGRAAFTAGAAIGAVASTALSVGTLAGMATGALGLTGRGREGRRHGGAGHGGRGRAHGGGSGGAGPSRRPHGRTPATARPASAGGSPAGPPVTATTAAPPAQTAVPTGPEHAAGGGGGGGGSGLAGGTGDGGAEGGGGTPPPGLSDEELGRLDHQAEQAPTGGGEESPLGGPAEVAQDAQAEGADLAQPAPEPEPSGGGGGGGAPIEDKPEPPTPDVANAEPENALAAAGGLPPAKLLSTLGGVAQAIGKSVGAARRKLEQSPPSMPRPSGAPATRSTPASESLPPPVDHSRHKVRRTRDLRERPTLAPKPLPAAPRSPVDHLPGPHVGGDAQGNLSEADTQAMHGAISQLPTTDPGLNVTTGAPPDISRDAAAGDAQVEQQHAHVEEATDRAHATAQAEAGQPMGEDQIYPDVPQETLTADVPAGGGEGEGAGGAEGGGPEGAGAAAGAAVGDAAGDEAASIVAEQEKGGEIKAAVAQGMGQMADKKREHDEKVAQEHTKAGEDAAKLESENAAQQAAARSDAKARVHEHRRQWTQEQQQVVERGKTEAAEHAKQGSQQISQQQQQAEREAAEHHAEGERQAAEARRKGEQEAERHRQEAKKESSGGFFGWIASKAKSFFDGIKNAIKSALDAAKAAVRAAVERARELANKVIDLARKAVVGIVKAIGAAIIAIGDRVLAAFPALRDRFRNLIKNVVKAAEDAVNRLAEGLKKGLKSLLDNLGKLINAAISLYGKALNWVVDQVKAAVKGAIDFAKNALATLANFAALVKDVAANPGQWLRNLGAAIVDGVKNHLWKAFKTAVMNWFNDKVEELVGFGKAIWNLLKKGGMGIVEVGKMLWEGLKSAIPGILIGILIEKLVSMLVPAAGAVLLIIQSIQAAWGTIKRILAALEKFMKFLRAVKSGTAGPLFAEAVAAGAVAAIEFVANFLLKKLKGPASKVGGKIREIAKRIGQKLAAVGKKIWGGVKRGAKSAFGAIKKGAKAAWGGIKKGASAVGRGLGRAGAAAKRMLGRVGKAIGRATGRAREALKKQYTRLKERYEKWKNKPLTKEQVLAKVSRALAIAMLVPISSAGWIRGVLNFVLNRYRKHGLKGLHLVKGPENKPGQFDVHAVMSPGHKVKTFTVNPPLKTRDLDLEEPSTALVAMLNGATPLGRHRSGSKTKHPVHGRPMHAEDKLLKYLRAAWSVLPLKPAGQENRIVVSITRTPCEACSNEFLKFEEEKKAEGHVVKFDIAAMSLYRATKATLAQFEIMKVLRSKGHTLTAWNVLNDLKEVLGEDYDPASVTEEHRKILEFRIEQLRKKLEELAEVKAGSTG